MTDENTAIAKITTDRPRHVGPRVPSPLIWLDLETTGLDEQQDEVLEIAIVVTAGGGFEEVERFHHVSTRAAHVMMASVDPFVIAMHRANGLWQESLDRELAVRPMLAKYERDLGAFDEYATIDEMLEGFVRRVLGPAPSHSADRPKLAGSSVHFDLGFVRRRFPRFAATLSHRLYCVSALNEHAMRCAPDAYESRPREGGVAHRAMPDIEHSIAVARHYAAELCGPARRAPAADPGEIDPIMGAGHA